MKLICTGTLALALTLSACRSHQTTSDAVVTASEAKVAQQNEAAYVTAIRFDQGSAQLTRALREQLETALTKANAAGRVTAVKVVTWADDEYPAPAQKALIDRQRDLADQRNRNLTTFLREQLSAKHTIETFNMAERPNALEQWLKTSDARMKNALENAGIVTTGKREAGLHNARKSVVMVVLENRGKHL